MAQILVRNLDECTVTALKERANAAGRSLEAEVRRILDLEGIRMEQHEEALAFAQEMKEALRGRTHTDSAILRHER